MANLAFVAALVLLVRLGERVVGRERAILGAALLAMFPFSTVFSMAYTESLFLLFMVGAFLAAERDRRALAGILLALSALTRLQGAVLIVPLFIILFARDGRRLRASQLWLLLGPLAALAFIGWVGAFAGSGSAYGAAQAAWGRNGVGAPGTGGSLADDLFSLTNAIQFATLLGAVFLLVYLRPDRIPFAYAIVPIGALLLAFASGSLLSLGRQVDGRVPQRVAAGRSPRALVPDRLAGRLADPAVRAELRDVRRLVRAVSRAVVLAIFVLSGAAGLVYEVVWARQLVLVFGNTTQAISAILTGFFGGMAIGSVAGGRLADRVRRPLRLYGLLELALVAVVLLTPLTFRLLHELYRGVFGSLETQPALLALLRFGLALLALGPATVMMGATLPTLTRYLSRDAAHLSQAFGRLYAANTIGAIVGTVAAGFVLIELVGLTGTLAVGAACSAVAGLVALALDRQGGPGAAVAGRIAPRTAWPPRRKPGRVAVAAPPDRTSAGAAPTLRLGLIVAFVSGLTSLGYQTLWTRLLASGTGNSTYIFTLILTCFLIGIAVGGHRLRALPALDPATGPAARRPPAVDGRPRDGRCGPDHRPAVGLRDRAVAHSPEGSRVS